MAATLLLALCPALFRKRGPLVLTLGAFSVPEEAYREIIPLFQKRWKEMTGSRVEVRVSFMDGGDQSRAVAAGFPADVAALALTSDIERLERAGLVTHDWKKGRYRGVVTRSVVAIAVREGNPQRIHGWGALAEPGVRVLISHPKTSERARWSFLALYGSAERGAADPYAAGDGGAFRFCAAVFRNVAALDDSPRETLRRFAGGWGDAAVACESDILAERLSGAAVERVIPRSAVLVENPVAVVDVNADRHGARKEAEAFVDFLWSPEAQEVFARRGFRPVDRRVMERFRGEFPPVPDLWKVDEFGGWSEVGTVFFGPGGLFDSVMEEVHAPAS